MDNQERDAILEAARLAPTDANRRCLVYQRGDTWFAMPSTSGLMGQFDATHRLAYIVTAPDVKATR